MPGGTNANLSPNKEAGLSLPFTCVGNMPAFQSSLSSFIEYVPRIYRRAGPHFVAYKFVSNQRWFSLQLAL